MWQGLTIFPPFGPTICRSLLNPLDYGTMLGCGISGMDSSEGSNGIRYHIFDTRQDTEFKLKINGTSACP